MSVLMRLLVELANFTQDGFACFWYFFHFSILPGIGGRLKGPEGTSD